MLVTAGTKDNFNMMTASWGGIGWLWNKPVAFIFIRPERYTYPLVEQNESVPVKDSIRAIKNNWPWILLVSANFLAWIGFSMRQGTVIYFCKYNLEDGSLTAYLNGILTITCLLSFLSMTFIVKYTKKFGAMLLGIALIILGYIGISMAGTSVAMITRGY